MRRLLGTVAHERFIYKGRLLDLKLSRVRLPNGLTVDLEVVEHAGAALVVPLLDKERVVMLRQFRPVIGAYLYELPAGTLAQNERPLSCARREIAEETGFSASRFKLLGVIFPVPGYSTEKIFIYKAEGLRRGRRRLEDDEVISSRVMTRRGVRRLFERGLIRDAKTICAFSLCGWLGGAS